MYLYCITNKVSGRKYYGISVDYKQRWATHKSAAKHLRYKTHYYRLKRHSTNEVV